MTEELAFARIMGTSVDATTKAVVVDVSGPGASCDPSVTDTDDSGERAIEQEAYGAIGLISRPLPKTESGAAEAVCRRTPDGLMPVACRDNRLNKLYPAPKDGTVALVGYAGAFDANEAKVSADGKGTPQSSVRTIYVPYAIVNGIPTKAHAIIIDGTAGKEKIIICHGDGGFIKIMSGKSISLEADDGSWVSVSPDTVVIQAKNVVINGNVKISGKTSIAPPGTPGALPAMTSAMTAATMLEVL